MNQLELQFIIQHQRTDTLTFNNLTLLLEATSYGVSLMGNTELGVNVLEN